MLEATREAYGQHLDISSWQSVTPEAWAARVLGAIEDDASVLGPGGRAALAKLASRGPAVVLDLICARIFSRESRVD